MILLQYIIIVLLKYIVGLYDDKHVKIDNYAHTGGGGYLRYHAINKFKIGPVAHRHWNGPCEPMCRKAILKSNGPVALKCMLYLYLAIKKVTKYCWHKCEFLGDFFTNMMMSLVCDRLPYCLWICIDRQGGDWKTAHAYLLFVFCYVI